MADDPSVAPDAMTDASAESLEKRDPADERGRAMLVSFAMLQARWDDQNSSYIDNFVPFVAQCVKSSGASVIATEDVQRQLKERFGLVIPQHALSTVIKRGVRQGLFRLQHHTLVPDLAALEPLNLEPIHQRAQRAYGQLLAKFVTFAKDEHNLDLTEEEVDDAFLAYITDRSLPIVRSTLLGEGYQLHLGNPGELEYLIAQFIVYLSQADVQGFDHLDMIVRGCMLATALYLPDPNDQARKITDLTVYLDTPVVIELLELVDEARGHAARELVKLLQDLGARVACFTHTLQETESLLLACSHMLSARSIDGRSKEIVSYALSRGWGPTDLEMKAAALDHELRGLGISVRDAPDYQVRTTLNEQRMETVLQSVVGYLRPETRLYDVKSLAAIWRIRGGRSQRHLESARAIFLTSNGALVRASAKCFEETPNGFDVPVCALDSELGTVVWLKQPMAAPDLPKRQIVADCVAALEPGNRLWERFLALVDQSRAAGGVTEEEYATLRYTVSARRALVEATLGDEQELALGSVPEILRRAKEMMTAEAQARIEAEVRARQEAEARADAEEKRATSAEASLKSEQRDHQAALRSVDEKREADMARRIDNKAHRRARRQTNVLYILLSCIIIAATFAQAGRIGGAIAVFLIVVAAVISIRHVLSGKALPELADRIERSLAKRYAERERKSLGL